MNWLRGMLFFILFLVIPQINEYSIDHA